MGLLCSGWAVKRIAFLPITVMFFGFLHLGDIDEIVLEAPFGRYVCIAISSNCGPRTCRNDVGKKEATIEVAS